MDNNNQAIPTDQQVSLIESLVKSGVLSPEALQSHVQANYGDNSPPAQSSSMNIDPETLHSIIQHAVNPNSVPMQDGDKMHPMDAISQITGAMNGPDKPAGIEHTGGPQVSMNAPVQGIIPRLLGRVTPGASLQSPTPGIIPGLLGMKTNTPVDGSNFFGAAQKAGVDKFLPNNLPQMPDGTPLVNEKDFTTALNAQKAVFGQGNQTYTSKDQLVSQGVPEDIANKLMAANPGGVTNKEITNYMGSKRLESSQQLADARTTMAGVARLSQLLKVQGFDALQPLAENAGKNLGAINRAQAAIDQITANGGNAIQSQRAELAAALGQVAGSSAGVLTDEKMNQFMPQSAKAKFGNWASYWTNENQPIDFTGFLPQMQDLLDREKQKNQENFQGAQALGVKVLSQTQPNQAATLTRNMQASPIVGNPSAMPQGGSQLVARKTKDGRTALFDTNTKQFVRYQ